MAILSTFLFKMPNFGQIFANIFNMCGRRRRGGGPPAFRRPEPRRAEGPVVAATAAQYAGVLEPHTRVR